MYSTFLDIHHKEPQSKTPKQMRELDKVIQILLLFYKLFQEVWLVFNLWNMLSCSYFLPLQKEEASFCQLYADPP